MQTEKSRMAAPVALGITPKSAIVLSFLCALMTQVSTRTESPAAGTVRVNKCCEAEEFYSRDHCKNRADVNETRWEPIFTDEVENTNLQIPYRFATGSPDCGSQQQWTIYNHEQDVLRLLPSGRLRHYIRLTRENEPLLDMIRDKKAIFQDYELGQYCLDKLVDDTRRMEYALVCGIKHETDWAETRYLMRNIINPITHLVSIICFLTIAIVYFVMPTLRDLVGNIITTISVCFVVSQTADMIRLLTVFNNHISLIIIETICYISLLGAFFWLNSLAYYICKTFKSRNVYLRITDSKKYCYYSAYAWSCTAVMGFLAIFAHYTMDYDGEKVPKFDEEQEQIGSLGIIIFFMPVAFTVLVNIFFFATTLKVLRHMNTYGRIHHKLKHSFRMFVLLFFIMTLTWIFFLMSFSKYDGLVYCYIIVNAFQAPLFFYVCIINQKHVSYLLRKTCCYINCICPCCRPEPEIEWGDEMTAMNTGIY